MSKMTLRFNLPDERTESEFARRGNDYWCALNEFANWIRSQCKYSEDTPAVAATKEQIREEFYRICADYGFDPREEP